MLVSASCFSSQIAVQLDREWYGLIFGFNTFMALVLQAILTGIVNTWLNVDTRTQVSNSHSSSIYIYYFSCSVCDIWYLLLRSHRHLFICWCVQNNKDRMDKKLSIMLY